MKYLLITIIFAVLCFACDKKDDFVPIYEPGSMEHGFATALKNGKAFTASGVGRKNSEVNSDSLFAIYFTTESYYGARREHLTLGFFKIEKSDYTAIPGHYNYNHPEMVECSYATLEDDGDVLEDFYQVDTTYQNRISIEDVDTSIWLVKGSFDLSFNVQQPKVKQYNPDNVKFTQGRFEIRIRD